MAGKGSGKQYGLFEGKVPKMPEGYYSGDKPNPNLRAFVEEHLREKPYDPETDDYDVRAFDKPINSTKATAIYNMHTYWSKKPHDAIREYIRHYTEPGDLVLDPFCGSGGTALAALMEGRKAIAIDRSPAATFITKNYCTPVDVDELRAAFEELKAKVKPEIDWLYETRCDRCGGKATTAYTVYSQVFQCPRCLERLPLFDCVEAEGRTKSGKPKKIRACPHCMERGITEEISTRSEKFGAIPVLVSYLCEEGCTPKRDQRRHDDNDPNKRNYFEQYDLAKLREIDDGEIPHWYPTDRMMHAPKDQDCWGVKWRAGTSNFRTVDELFTKRNLWALAALKAAIDAVSGPAREAIEFCWSSVLLNLSRMTTDRDRLGFLKGTYYVPPVCRCTNVLGTVENKLRLLCPGWELIAEVLLTDVCISTEDARELGLPTASVDYVFTDPPYADKQQYGELNFVWEAWLGLDTHWHGDEIIINDVRGKTEVDWAHMMTQAMAECYRILKPGRCLSLCYHDTSEGTWGLIQDIMAEAGFIADDPDAALFIDTGQKTYNQKVADKVNMRDLVINFRKPKPGEINPQLVLVGDEDETTFREKVQAIIRKHLSASPGATRDRVYDEVVSRMVRSGQMEAHDFDELLTQVAEPAGRDGNGQRWYLNEAEEAKIDTAEAEKEDAAAESVDSMMTEWLKANPGDAGVHYSDIFEHYIYAVRDKPRRELAEWLPDYFFKTDEGTWRPPANEEEERLKADARAKGHNRRVKRYLSYLHHGLPVPEAQRPSDATLAEWIRHCKRSGLYGQGKLLYELGGLNLDELSEEAAVEVDEDYQTCVRMLDREPTSKRSKREKKDGNALQLDL